MEKTIVELLGELDAELSVVSQKRTNFNKVESEYNKNTAEAEFNYKKILQAEQDKISKAQKELIDSTEKAKTIQQEIQARTSSFLDANIRSGRVRSAG